MPTVINNPATETRDNGTGFLVGLLVLLLIAFLFFYYGLQALRSAGSTSVKVPDRIDVNVNPGNNQAPAQPPTQ